MGFAISQPFPYIEASPDGLVQCRFRSHGLLEIKCPWKFRGLTIEGYAQQKDNCLEQCNGQIKLKRHNSYYFQVQCLVGCDRL